MKLLGDLLRGLPLVSREGDPRALGPCADVWPEERHAVQRAVEKRKNEYFATRHLARQALAELSVPAAPLLNNDDRSPRWPEGIVGSLTHTDVWCGVAVAKAFEVTRGVGVDMERLNSVSPEVAKRIFSERELSIATRADFAVRFSAKESFYKAIYSSVRRYVGFEEVEVELRGERSFEVLPVSPRLVAEIGAASVPGLFTCDGGLCCTAIVLR